MLVEAASVRTSPQTFLGLGKDLWGESSEWAAWFPVGAHTRGTLKRPEILSILSHSLAQNAGDPTGHRFETMVSLDGRRTGQLRPGEYNTWDGHPEDHAARLQLPTSAIGWER